MTISEKVLWDLSQARGCEARFDDVCRSYFWSWNATFIGRRYTATGVSVLFKHNDCALVLSISLSAFQTPAYARTLIQHQLDVAECERRFDEKRFQVEQSA